MPPAFLFPQIPASSVSVNIGDPVDPQALEQAKAIVSSIKDADDKSKALLEKAKAFGDMQKEEESYVVPNKELKEAYENLPQTEREALDRIHARVLAFATAQRNSITDITIPIPGGSAGHRVTACTTAGCYAPGGRYPLPSSVIMTCVTARAAGCTFVVCSSPRPAPITLAAAYVSGCDIFVKVGGAQAIAAMAYGIPAAGSIPEIPRADVIVGPGNKWVTAAKSIVNGFCGIDMLAGPSEVLVICDKTANADVVAADLIAQAEHDVVARPLLVSDDQEMIDKVTEASKKRLETMPEPNRTTALTAFSTGFSVLCSDVPECVKVSDEIAPEHLEIQTEDAMNVGMSCKSYGGLFIGEDAAEVMGDYGAGPNHTLPTGGTGRYTGGLSVFNFLGIRTWMRIDDKKESQQMVNDTSVMARLEGLEGHARAADCRKIEK
ncbi:hypothetical protein TrVE_jg12029 [Triparma verrucosa]|uniref:Histidinol dehydrogenase n=1 Tax=Triparma verrucosa TaxID=1606542 RepID=A0A9W7BYD3_9STRA|nr:hypothetical protein TrVE_jg12029 [Triparma verrucosa]